MRIKYYSLGHKDQDRNSPLSFFILKPSLQKLIYNGIFVSQAIHKSSTVLPFPFRLFWPNYCWQSMHTYFPFSYFHLFPLHFWCIALLRIHNFHLLHTNYKTMLTPCLPKGEQHVCHGICFASACSRPSSQWSVTMMAVAIKENFQLFLLPFNYIGYRSACHSHQCNSGFNPVLCKLIPLQWHVY